MESSAKCSPEDTEVAVSRRLTGERGGGRELSWMRRSSPTARGQRRSGGESPGEMCMMERRGVVTWLDQQRVVAMVGSVMVWQAAPGGMLTVMAADDQRERE